MTGRRIGFSFFPIHAVLIFYIIRLPDGVYQFCRWCTFSYTSINIVPGNNDISLEKPLFSFSFSNIFTYSPMYSLTYKPPASKLSPKTPPPPSFPYQHLPLLHSLHHHHHHHHHHLHHPHTSHTETSPSPSPAHPTDTVQPSIRPPRRKNMSGAHHYDDDEDSPRTRPRTSKSFAQNLPWVNRMCRSNCVRRRRCILLGEGCRGR